MVTAASRIFVLSVCVGCWALVTLGCYSIRGLEGGGQTAFSPPRHINVSDIALSPGYRNEPVVTGLTFPTGVTFDDRGRPYIIEAGYSYGEGWTTPGLFRVEPDGQLTVVAKGGNNGPWTGVTFHKGNFYIAEGGAREGGRLLGITPDGHISVLLDQLPSVGDHHTNGPVVGPDGWLYFAQGSATNSAVVGEDNAAFGWLKRHPAFHDIPCRDIRLEGMNFTSGNPLRPGANDPITTGAFSAFGTPTVKGHIIPGGVPCNGSVMRLRPDTDKPELIAWGFRNPFGLAFSPTGRLYVTDNSYDVRGSRPVFGAGDLLWEVQRGVWYGWPDFTGPPP